MASEGVMLAFAGLLAGVAIAAVVFGWRVLSASRTSASPAAVPATDPQRADEAQVDPFPVVTLRPKPPWTIIVVAAFLVLGNIAWVVSIFAGLSTGMLPTPLSLLVVFLALTPWVCAFGLVEGYGWAWWLVVATRMYSFVRLAGGTMLLSVGLEQPWLTGDEQWLQLPDWFRSATLVIIWAYELALLLPLFTPSARAWCSPKKYG